jgi:hypothetical protein
VGGRVSNGAGKNWPCGESKIAKANSSRLRKHLRYTLRDSHV